MDKGGGLMYSLESGKPDIPRASCPYHATVTMKIDVRKMNNDGSLDHKVLGNDILKKYGMTNKAQVCVSGPNQHECIKKLLEMLEKLNG
jgi:hypothetical protein